jgi:dienelactone hydrolase
MRTAAIVLAALALTAGCGGSSEAEEEGVPERVEVEELSLSAGSTPVPAYAVAAPRERERSAAVYVHGQGGDRQELLEHARWLAARGAVAVTITAPSSGIPPETVVGVEALERERELARLDVAAVSAAVDYLARRPDVDPDRIGYVGYSAGARLGALVAGSEPRIRAYVLMSGGADPVSTYVAQAPPEFRADVQRVLGDIDPLEAIARSKAAFLIQNGRRDGVVPRRALDHLASAAPAGADVRWYDADHALGDAAYRDQLEWLERELELEGPPVRGAPTGP